MKELNANFKLIREKNVIEVDKLNINNKIINQNLKENDIKFNNINETIPFYLMIKLLKKVYLI